jgi:hypothetical protein
MHPLARHAVVPYAILATVFFATAAGTFFVARAWAPEKQSLGISRSTLKAASARTPKSYHPEHADHVAQLLRPAIATITRPKQLALGQSGRITLTIEHDQKGVSKADFPRAPSVLAPVKSTNSDEQETSVYHIKAGDRITADLYDSSSDVALPTREPNPLVLKPDGTTWMWHVPGSEPGARSLEFEMYANYSFESAPESWPLGLIRLDIPVVPTPLQWTKYYLAQVLAAWNYLVGAAGGLVGLAAALPIVLKWFPFRRSRKEAPDAQAHA